MNKELIELSRRNIIIHKTLTMVELNQITYIEGLEQAVITLAKDNERLFDGLVKSRKKECR